MTEEIGIAGDWHGNTRWACLRLLDFAGRGIKKILHLGDFGLWHGNSGRKYLYRTNKVLGAHGMVIYVTLGNHENFVLAGNLQLITEGENAGWMYFPDYPNILFAPRPFRWEWSGVSFISMGGANSIDRFQKHRVENISWWAGEQISYGEALNARAGGQADVMVAHDCPEGVDLFSGKESFSGGWSVEDLRYANQSRVALRGIVDVVKPKLYFHGHYHFLYDMVTELEDGDGETYDLHTIGLDKDDCPNNLGILELPTLEFTVIEYTNE